ncbi:MAG: hypothetical protein Q8M00_00770 [bacterium]|nr:hypothetical protein [bacterium]
MFLELSSIYPFLTALLQILKNWWWVLLVFILWKPFLFLYLWWRILGFLARQRSVLLEIKLPKEILKPIRAMETVLSGIQGAMYHPPDFWEKWIDGQVQLTFGIEMVSIDGDSHFFIRTPSKYRSSVESSFYAQYPEIEITEVDDYTKYVPQSIPNKDWDLFGSNFKLWRDDHYPIKTYIDFETEREKEEEEVVDPVAGLLEAMAKINKGEQLWIQFLLDPVGDADLPLSLSKWRKKGEELRDKLARRPGPAAAKPIIQEAAGILITGKVPEAKKEEKEIIPPEMKLTPGEREVLAAIEKKMAKPIFETTIRFIFLGRRDAWFKQNFRLVLSYFNQYANSNLNALYPDGKSLTKIHKSVFFPFLNMKFIRSRRQYLRARKLFRKYTNRFTPFFPMPGGTFMLNTEEVASLFHFPSERAAPAPGFPRIEAKKRGASPGLPVE